MKVLTFGDKPAAAMAQTALKMTAEESKDTYPRAAQVLKQDTYMDDICTSMGTVDEAKQLTSDIDIVLNKGGFNIKEWLSNKSLNSEKPNKESITLGHKDKKEKVLGVKWDFEEDSLIVNVKLEDKIMNDKITKRKALGVIAQVFDPIGFVAPVVVKLKMKMQDLWESCVDWDEDLPE